MTNTPTQILTADAVEDLLTALNRVYALRLGIVKPDEKTSAADRHASTIREDVSPAGRISEHTK